jgi:serine/threonine-protein kinase
VATETPRSSPTATGTLLGSGIALAALAVYQWMELLSVRAGHTPLCAVNATVNCATVWSSTFAVQVHALLAMPVAALGIIYGVVATALAGLVVYRERSGADASAFLAGVKVWAAIGVVSCVVFLGASLQAGAICLTCIGTYVLTAVYAFAAFKLLPAPLWPTSAALVPGAAWALVLAVPVYLLLLIPGRDTPNAGPPKMAAGSGPDELVRFIESLPPREQESTSYARSVWLGSRPLDNSAYPVRIRKGPADAPVRIVDFTDILCGHCQIFESVMEEIARVAPAGSFSLEPRYYPLDGECNPDVPRVWGDGVRCLGAKVQLCLESSPKFYDVRHALFENQQNLTTELIVDTAVSRGGIGKDALLACVASADTTARLRQDIEYARRYHIEGTPLVLINDREAPPAPAFILGMVLAKGDANASFFAKLPPPPIPRQ